VDKPFLIQTPPNEIGDKETLKVFPSGRIRCLTCKYQIFNKNRLKSSHCKHVIRFLEAVRKGDITKYEEISK